MIFIDIIQCRQTALWRKVFTVYHSADACSVCFIFWTWHNLFCTFDFLQWHMRWNLCCWIWSIPVLSFWKLVTCITTSPLIWCALPCTSSHQEWLAFDTNICFGRRYFLIKYIFCLAPHLIRSDSPVIQTFVLPGDILWLDILCLALHLIRTDLLSNICLPLNYLRPLFWCVDCQIAVRGDKTCIWTLHGMHHRNYTHEQFRHWALQVESFCTHLPLFLCFQANSGGRPEGLTSSGMWGFCFCFI